MKGHKDLDVWKKSMDLVVEIYNITKKFPTNEIYGLSSQIKRAAISVPSNIAEGAGRKGEKEFIQFLYIGLGSLAEIETQLILAKRLNFVSEIEVTLENIDKIKQMLNGLIRYLRKGKRNS